MRGRRRAGGGQSRHADDWLITYADTITLLLCIFAVLLALDGAKLHQAAHADTPAAAGAPAPSAILPAASIVAPLHELADMPRPAEEADDDATDQAMHPDRGAADEAWRPASMPSGEPMRAAEVVAVATTRPDVVTSMRATAAAAAPGSAIGAPPAADHERAALPSKADAQTPPDRTGDRITIFQFDSAAFFASGSANLSGSGQSILTDLLDRLASAEFAGYRITVQGHTDDAPIRSFEFPSNWELSAARAAAVVRFFVEHGIQADRLRAAGYADTRPLAPNRDAAGKPILENQAKNRRVVIELEKIDRSGT